ncbi:uncharacterized protein LOC144538121 isoform X2 [Centroberyx gerrardi]
MKPVWSLGVLLLGCAFGIPVPSQNDTRQHDQYMVNLPSDNKGDNSTRNDSSLQINGTMDNFTQLVQSNDTWNDTGITPFMTILPMPNFEGVSSEIEEPVQGWNGTDGNSTHTRNGLQQSTFADTGFSGIVGYAAPPGCQLSICALMNLGHDMQLGGDEKAGRATSDPFGHGK